MSSLASGQVSRHELIVPQLFLTDPEAKFSKSIGWTKGERTGRYAMIIDHGKVTYAENEPGGDVTVSSLLRQRLVARHTLTVKQVSSAEAVLAKL